LQVNSSFSQKPVSAWQNQDGIEIKSLKAFASGDETSFPVLISPQDGELTIEFDLKCEFVPNLNILFRFCDKDWNPVDNIFLLNYGENIAHNLDYEILPFTVEDTRYHFRSSFPDQDKFVSFPFSGKWRFYITDSQDTSTIYASGKFYVVYIDVGLSASIKKEQLEDKVYFPLALGRVFNITSELNLPEELFPGFVDHVEIIENQKIENPIIVDRIFNTNTRQFYWNGDKKLSFTARDILPGNEYRQTDTRNFNKFNSKNVKAQFDGLEYSRFFKQGKRDFNGGSIFLNYKNDYATYLNVTFSIRPPQENFGSIFLVGNFNNWQLLQEYEMENNSGIYSKTVELKRGTYDYLYVAADVVNGKIKNADWLILEGNYWETSNTYHIFLYYKDPNYGGYDRLIGYSKIVSR